MFSVGNLTASVYFWDREKKFINVLTDFEMNWLVEVFDLTLLLKLLSVSYCQAVTFFDISFVCLKFML